MHHRIKALKYLTPFIFFIGASISFQTTGWMVWINMIIAWILVPVLELVFKPNPTNLETAEEELVKKDSFYDWILWDRVGRITVMGILCGSFGINVAHELGHRVNRYEQTLAKFLLLTSLYMHFFTEHNKGHHTRVATHEDPSSARKGEWVYLFYFRTIIMGFVSAWEIANNESRKKNGTAFSWKNEMIQFQLIQGAFLFLIYWFFGFFVLTCFLGAALIGILLLETVNYIEHYGLQREQLENGRYERAMPAHSWNSNHVVGRLMLFELSRHSDHHYLAID